MIRTAEAAPSKRQLRARMRAVRASRLIEADLDRAERVALRVLALLPPGCVVGAFAAHRGELDVASRLDARGIPLAWPRVLPDGIEMTFHRARLDELAPGFRGIREPPAEAPIVIPDAFLVPGLAFSPDGMRLGSGLGFYDRFLARHGQGKLRIGIAPDEAIVERLPADPWDVPLTHVITPSQTLDTSHAGPSFPSETKRSHA